jgi:hypothetical protein
MLAHRFMRALPKDCPTARDRLAFGSLSRFRFGSGASSCGVTAAALASLSLSATLCAKMQGR